MTRKTSKGTICIVLAVMLALLLAVPVGAASKTSKAKKAYRKLMNSKKVEWCGWGTTKYGEKDGDKFALINIDKKGAPELVVTGDDMYHFHIYTYTKKKAKHLGGSSSGSVKFYPNKKLVYMTRIHSGCENAWYSKFNGKKLVTVAEAKGIGTFDPGTDNYIVKYKYYKNGKKVTKKEYKVYVKKLMKNAKQKKIKMRKATKSNYRKYLK